MAEDSGSKNDSGTKKKKENVSPKGESFEKSGQRKSRKKFHGKTTYSIGGHDLTKKEFDQVKRATGGRGLEGGGIPSERVKGIIAERKEFEKGLVVERFKEKEKGKLIAKETAEKELVAEKMSGLEPSQRDKLEEEGKSLDIYNQILGEGKGRQARDYLGLTPEEFTQKYGSGEASPIEAGDILGGIGLGGLVKSGVTLAGKQISKEIAKRTKDPLKDAILKAIKDGSPERLKNIKNTWETTGKVMGENTLKKVNNVKSDDLFKLSRGFKMALGVGTFTTTLGIQGMVFWASSDNIATSASMGSNALLDQVTFAEIPPSLDEVDKQKTILRGEIKKARRAMRLASFINPIGYPLYIFYRSVVDTQENTMERNFELVDSKMGIGIEQPTEETTDL